MDNEISHWGGWDRPSLTVTDRHKCWMCCSCKFHNLKLFSGQGAQNLHTVMTCTTLQRTFTHLIWGGSTMVSNLSMCLLEMIQCWPFWHLYKTNRKQDSSLCTALMSVLLSSHISVLLSLHREKREYVWVECVWFIWSVLRGGGVLHPGCSFL